MNIRLELYKVFCEVAKEKNISRASQNLFISQSAVSQSIKQLEKEMNIKLFIRNAKGVELTQNGELLYQYANSAIELLEQGVNRIEKIKVLEEGELRIGASDTVSKHILSKKLEDFHKAYPKIKLKIVNRTTYEAIDLLKSGKLDLAIINMPVNDDAIETEEYMNIHDIFVTSSLVDKAPDKIYSLKEISELPLILLERKSNSRIYVENFFLKNGVILNPEIELGSHDLLLEFAKINLGVACVIKEFSEEYLKNNVLTELKTYIEIPKRSIGIATLKSVDLSNAAKKFLEFK